MECSSQYLIADMLIDLANLSLHHSQSIGLSTHDLKRIKAVEITSWSLYLQVLDRGERIELLVDKTDHLQSQAFTFTRDSRKLKRKMWWQKSRMLLLIVLLLLIIAYVTVCFVCSPTFQC